MATYGKMPFGDRHAYCLKLDHGSAYAEMSIYFTISLIAFITTIVQPLEGHSCVIFVIFTGLRTVLQRITYSIFTERISAFPNIISTI